MLWYKSNKTSIIIWPGSGTRCSNTLNRPVLVPVDFSYTLLLYLGKHSIGGWSCYLKKGWIFCLVFQKKKKHCVALCPRHSRNNTRDWLSAGCLILHCAEVVGITVVLDHLFSRSKNHRNNQTVYSLTIWAKNRKGEKNKTNMKMKRCSNEIYLKDFKYI